MSYHPHSKLLEIAYFHHKLKRHSLAIDICAAILQEAPEHAEALYLSALSRIMMGDNESGAAELLRVMRLCPDRKLYGVYFENLKRAGRLAEGRLLFQQWVKQWPDDFSTHYHLGQICLEMNDYSAAETAFIRSEKLNGSHAPTLAGMAMIRNNNQLYHETERLLKKALELNPESCHYLNNLAGTLKSQGRADEAEEYYRKALAVAPDNSGIHSNRLINLLCTLKHSPEQIYAAHIAWARECTRGLGRQSVPNDNNPDAERAIRLGYVSADFKQHPVAFFILPLLLAHNRQSFDINIYSNVARPDYITSQFLALGHNWTDISDMSDDDACETIRRDEVDILIDLNGHTVGNRLLLFARKPAPVQVTWLGYANTTGLCAMDYRITDFISDPPGTTEGLHSEKLFRMPRSFICYSAPLNPPPVGPTPALSSGIVTFGALNNFAKTNEKMFDLWARILKRTPNSRLLMKVSGIRHEPLRNRVLEAFANLGVKHDRIILHEWKENILEHLDFLNQVDIALDTFPYNGTTTTCEALFMGVPVISLAGRVHVSRVGASLLNHLGVQELVASSEEEYITKAAELGSDMSRIDKYRSVLRSRMLSSPLMDIEGFTRTLEAAFRQMWRIWCASDGKEHPQSTKGG